MILSTIWLAWSAAQKWFLAVLDFCSKPPGSWIAAALATCLGLWWFGQHEYNRGHLACETEHAEAAAQEVLREVKVTDAVNTASNLRTNESKKTDTDNKAKVIYLHDKAAALPTASDECIPADIADGLRSLK